MKDIFNSIKNKHVDKSIQVSMLIFNDKKEILVDKILLERVNKKMWFVPTITIKELNKKDILDGVKSKYNVNILDINGYINENEILDDNCNTKINVNLFYNDNVEHADIGSFKWMNIEEIKLDKNTPEILKEALEIYKFNEKIE
ncbi:MAG: hypothetical protein IKV94_05260 [Clostridia bacterium]|nr:hypothetical protein [Clostridia bacterium]